MDAMGVDGLRSGRTGPNLLLLCVVCGSWAFSFGLGSQAVSLWLDHYHYNNLDIGLSHTAYYLGLGLGSLLVPLLLRWSGRWCPLAGLALSGLTLALFPWGGGLAGYLLLRLVNGTAGAMSLVPLETAIGHGAPLEQRTRQLAFYGVALTLGGALGVWCGLHWYRPGGVLAFVLSGGVSVMAAAALRHGLPCDWRLSSTADAGPAATRLLRVRHFPSFATAWCQGFLEGGMLAFLSLYLLWRGFSEDEAGSLMALTMLGVILFQVPISWLADRFGRMGVLLLCYAVVGVALVLVPGLGSFAALGLTLFAFGGCCGAMYPLGLALLGERVPAAALARAYSWYLAIECLGSQLGAAAMGQARDWWGEASMFAVALAAVAGVPAAWGILRWTTSRAEDNVVDSAARRAA